VIADAEQPTVTVDTSIGPRSSLGVSGSAQTGQGSSVTTPAEALRLDEIRRLRLLANWGAVVALVAAVSLIPMTGDGLAKALHLPGLFALGACAIWVSLRLRDPARYQPWVIVTFAVCAAFALSTSFYYWGVYSSAVLFVPIVMYFLGSGSFRAPVVILLVLACVPHAVLAVLISFDVIADRGVVRAWALEAHEQLAVAGIAQIAFGIAFMLARSTRRSTSDALEQLEAALVGIGKREALLAEARQDLEQALLIGGPGAYTGQDLGSFRLGNLLGRGAMGEVYEASHVSSGEPAAVKVLAPTLIRDGKSARRFLRELQIAAALESPHLVKVLEVAPASSSVPYLAMERLRGDSLADILREVSRLKLEQVVTMIEQLAKGIGVAHRAGVVHRDLKPRNVFRHVEGGATTWKILDFGVSKHADEDGTLTGANIIGTPAYMAPEQARGKDVDHRADVHALGAIAYRALTGRPAFAGPDVPSILYAVTHDMPPAPTDMASLPAGVDLALVLAFAKEPARRYASAAELAAALAGAARGVLDADMAVRAATVLREQPWGMRAP
jgi:serine/threonine-protein kinase